MLKLLINKITLQAHPSERGVLFIKTKPYPLDSFSKTTKKNSQSFWELILNKFRNKKLNPKSFADGSHTPKGPYFKTTESVELSNEYLKSNYLSEYEKITDGFRDAGGSASFDKFGNCIWAKREVITVDKNADVYLQNAIKYVKENTSHLSEDKKLKFIYNLILDISGDSKKAAELSEILGSRAAGEEKLLGKIFEHGAAVCRHKAIMFKILAEEVGIKTRLLRGNSVDLFGYGRHVWNEVKLSNGQKFLVDTQNSKLIDLYSTNASKNPKLASYCNENNRPIYTKNK